jgi:FkbM family methyltransferase
VVDRINGVTTKKSPTVTREHMRWAYRLFLDREVEDETLLDPRATTTAALRQQFLTSSEYQINNANLSALGDKWVIVPTALGFRIFVRLNEMGVSRPILMDDYETAAVQLFESLVKPGDRVFDIGANIGFHTMVLSKLVGPDGEVWAFEPVNYLYRALLQSISENGFESRCHPFNCALSDETGSGIIRHMAHTANFGGAHLTETQADDGHSYDRVETRTLTEFLSDKPCSLIKIDVEGAEMKVLRGATELLRRDRPKLFVELFNAQLKQVSRCSATDMIRYLSTLGYRCFTIGAGAPGPEIREYDSSELINVVFLPR